MAVPEAIHVTVPMVFHLVEVISNGGRRRRFAPEEKAPLVLRAFAPGVSVLAFSRERGIDPSLLYRWRRQMGWSTGAAGFGPVLITPDAAARGARADRVEIVLTNGRRLVVSETVDAAALARIIAAVERA